MAPVPPGVVTVTWTAPLLAGVTVSIVVSLTTVKPTARREPKRTSVVPVKWCPERTTSSPPPVDPWFGETVMRVLRTGLATPGARGDGSSPTGRQRAAVTVRGATTFAARPAPPEMVDSHIGSITLSSPPATSCVNGPALYHPKEAACVALCRIGHHHTLPASPPPHTQCTPFLLSAAPSRADRPAQSTQQIPPP
ncbi:hypothetical protein GCM10020000_42990 [Streptomyces olivoverticillatus]